MFDMCNDFKLEYLQNFNGFDKLNLIRGNKKIIDIINFCGNKHMYDSMEKKPNEGGVDKSHYFNIHHSPEQYLALESHLQQYITQNNII